MGLAWGVRHLGQGWGTGSYRPCLRSRANEDHATRALAEQGAGVRFGLEQARDQDQLEEADDTCVRFQADEVHGLRGEGAVVGLPPAGFTGVEGEAEEG